MIEPGRVAKILLIDSNVYFSKRLSDALKREGFEVLSSTQPAFALTTLEYDTPTAIVCATNMREMGALEIAKIIHADPKNAALPIIALGDGSQRALMEAFQAGCDDYIDRGRQPAVIATHIRNIIISKAEGFQPTQMLAQADTSLSGSLSHHDLPGVLQMLGHARQTGALHINAAAADAVLFFDAGTITHAECGNLFGDEAVIHIVKSCVQGGTGVYKFVYGASSAQCTVLRSATDLMLDAMREYDENANNATTEDSAKETAALDALSSPDTFACPAPARAYADPNEGAEGTPEENSPEAEDIVGLFTENPETSVQETSVQDESVQDVSVQDASVQDASVQDASVQDASVQDTSVQDGPVQDAQVQENTAPEHESHESAVADSSRTDITLQENSEVDKILSELADQHRLSEENLADKEAL
jgi:CheY-like chemotaxis protein